MPSYRFQSDVIGISFCQGTIHNSCYSIVALVTDLLCHLTNNLRGAWRTVNILCIGTDRCQQTVQTKIRLLLKKQSDQGLRCLPLHQLLLDALMQCYIKLYQF